MKDLVTTIFGLIAWAWEYVWIAFIIFFIWWMIKVYFNEKEIKEKEAIKKSVERHKQMEEVDNDMIESLTDEIKKDKDGKKVK